MGLIDLYNECRTFDKRSCTVREENLANRGAQRAGDIGS